MPSIFHYTRFETFMSYILPSGFIRTNSLKHMNDPRESLDWAFGGINVPYESIFPDYYNDDTAIDCQFKLGSLIKERYQILCFSGAKEKGWNNEMMWAHYGGLHSGICLEFDEEILKETILEKYPESDFRIEGIRYKDGSKDPWLYWERSMTYEKNMSANLQNICKAVTLTKSTFWEREDEKRLVFINTEQQYYIPIKGSLKTVYVGVKFNVRDLLPMLYDVLGERFNLSRLIYQHNKFERWGIRKDKEGELRSYDFKDIIKENY